MEQQQQFKVVYMEEVVQFLDSLPSVARNKIVYNIRKVSSGFRSADLFKKLDGAEDIWEFRTLYEGIQYRLLAFWDKEQQRIVVATHGFVKKTWKVPAKEIERAEALRQAYYESNKL